MSDENIAMTPEKNAAGCPVDPVVRPIFTAPKRHMVRPTRCYLCSAAMYYSGDVRHVPELRVTLEDGEREETHYIHAHCWDMRMKPQSA